MDHQLKAQLRQIIGYGVGGSVDDAGQVQSVTTATCFARVEPRYRELAVGTTVQERTNHFVVLDESFPLTEAECRGALFWLPGDAMETLSGRETKMVHYCYGEFGELDHVEVIL